MTPNHRSLSDVPGLLDAFLRHKHDGVYGVDSDLPLITAIETLQAENRREREQRARRRSRSEVA